VKEFLVMTEEFASDVSAENFRQVESKFGEIKKAIEKLNSDL